MSKMLNVKNLILVFLIVSISVLSLSGAESNKAPIRLKVATFNIGHFNQGRLGGFQGEGRIVDAELNNWKRWIGEQSLDILGVQEWNRYFNKDSTIIAEDEILKPFYNNIYWGKENTWIYNGIATNYQLENVYQVDWDGDYYAVIGDLIIDGLLIKVISTHIPWQQDWHEKSFDNLIELLSKYEYFICMGDMNANDSTQIKFIDAGFNIANGGNMGWFTTAQGSVTASGYRGGVNYNIDNIITSRNIKIFNIQAPKTRLNDLDHLPLIADLIITRM